VSPPQREEYCYNIREYDHVNLKKQTDLLR
jgi:hypothetical protein